MKTLDNLSVISALIRAINKAKEFNDGVVAAPAALLWPDDQGLWEPIVSRLQAHFPELVKVGPYRPSERSGPAIWVRALLARKLDAESWEEGSIPIIYLPGVSRQLLRGVESCPPELKPLAELQYRGAFFSQTSGRDWTPFAFLKSKDGLGLDIAQDKATVDALQRALSILADTDVQALRGRRLESSDFDQLLSPDPARDLLQWMNAADAIRVAWSGERWDAFSAICDDVYGFDPASEGVLSAAERLAEGEGAWAQLWSRFSESPASYPGIIAILEKTRPSTLIYDAQRWPSVNADEEEHLRSSLLTLSQMSSGDAANTLAALEVRHGVRRDWVWAKLGFSPLASALKYLSLLSGICRSALGGTTPDEMASLYQKGAWTADDAALKALASSERLDDQKCIHAALQAVYAPWLGDAATRLQELVREHGYPGDRSEARAPITGAQGECLFFADGLRYDVAERLRAYLGSRGHSPTLDARWSALPSVTATSKPAISPVSESISGFDVNEEFQPSDLAEQKRLTTDRFRRLLSANGYQVLRGDELGDPRGKAWVEHGDLDTLGHDQGWKLARRVDEQIREIAERLEALLNAGWRTVRIVTDHGWLLLPGGLPKVDLPKYLADTRWSRCAMLKSTTQADGLLVVDWRWESSVRIALAPGISAFKAGLEYSHGGLSLQECLTPILRIEQGAQESIATIDAVIWRGLRCRVTVSDAPSGAIVDIRKKPADPGTSVVQAPKAPGEDGVASLVVPNDELLDIAAHIVVLDSDGNVIAKTTTCIGGGD